MKVQTFKSVIMATDNGFVNLSYANSHYALCKCRMRVISLDFQILWIWKKSVAFATLKFEFECSP